MIVHTNVKIKSIEHDNDDNLKLRHLYYDIVYVIVI